MTPSKPFASGSACWALTSRNARPARVTAGRRIPAKPNSEFTAAAQGPGTASRCPTFPCPTCRRHYGEWRSWAARSFIRDRRGRSAVTQRGTPSPSWRLSNGSGLSSSCGRPTYTGSITSSDRTTSFRAVRGQPVRVTLAGYLLGDTSILQVGTAIAVYCRFMHRYTSPSRPPCWNSFLAAGSILVWAERSPWWPMRSSAATGEYARAETDPLITFLNHRSAAPMIKLRRPHRRFQPDHAEVGFTARRCPAAPPKRGPGPAAPVAGAAQRPVPSPLRYAAGCRALPADGSCG